MIYIFLIAGKKVIDKGSIISPWMRYAYFSSIYLVKLFLMGFANIFFLLQSLGTSFLYNFESDLSPIDTDYWDLEGHGWEGGGRDWRQGMIGESMPT